MNYLRCTRFCGILEYKLTVEKGIVVVLVLDIARQFVISYVIAGVASLR